MTDTPAPDRFDEMARPIAHKMNPRCTGDSGYGHGDALRYHSKRCDENTVAIAAALRQQHIELKAENAKLREACRQAETFLMIVPPRSHTAEALETLDQLRAALNEDKP